MASAAGEGREECVEESEPGADEEEVLIVVVGARGRGNGCSSGERDIHNMMSMMAAKGGISCLSGSRTSKLWHFYGKQRGV